MLAYVKSFIVPITLNWQFKCACPENVAITSHGISPEANPIRSLVYKNTVLWLCILNALQVISQTILQSLN